MTTDITQSPTNQSLPNQSLSDPRRLGALRRLNLLDTPAEEAFDRLTRLAAALLRVPTALVSLVDEDRQFFKSQVGLPEPWASRRETPLTHSFCQHVVDAGEPLVIADARAHPLVCENLATRELGVVAYAGIPLITSGGATLGSFCVIDTQPRQWTPEELASLTDLARATVTEIELRLVTLDATRTADRIRRLYNVTAALSDARTSARVVDIVLREGLAALGADAGSVALLNEDGTRIETLAAVGYARDLLDAYRSMPLDATVPLADAVRSGQAIFLTSGRDWTARYEEGEAHAATGYEAAAAIPLQLEGRIRGAVALSFAEGRSFGAEDRDFMAALAGQCAQALERARLYEAQQEAQARAERERDHLRQVLDVLPEAIVIADTTPAFIVANRAAKEILGGDAVGHPVPIAEDGAYAAFGARRLDGTPQPSAELPLQRALLRGAVVQGAQLLLRNAADGRDIPILANAAPLRGPTGALEGAVVAFQDITAIRDLERAKEEFLSSAAHDLKTPLTTIQGNVQLAHRRLRRLSDANPAAGALATQLAHIEDAATRMLGLINELADVTRVQMGSDLSLDRQPVDLVALTQGVAERHRGITEHRILIDAALAELIVDVDAARIERVVTNLLSNALKYSPDGGDITARIAAEDSAAGPTAVIAVRDRGIGIPAADLPHIFERFQRGGNVAGRIQGTGIGLASARHIVEQHGGAISVQSEEGQGSTFTVRLPLSPP